MAMDHTLANIYKETMKKEDKFTRKWKDAAAASAGASPSAIAGATASLSPKKRSSCQLNFLDQTLGIVKNPHVPTAPADTKADALLRYGVSAEGQGRSAYLNRQTKMGPTERYGRQVTTSHEVGWTSRAATKTYTCSPFARRPLVNMQFYRPMGISFSAGTL
mmetsp:Transcript_11613/g.23528  ORF Transcript_11613/g.23528 Transcript_11613/m.23528 type:complete len:162 (-) Transcript_11613:171-656(-)|eukprot:CAMPEP_0113819356 /NCGR_PEP_ID=MMETSP0328-20130328/698_1 /TAXON_ID=39455 /ORGANISM="Alexandrium minutum" /LENGTH=161 /DNA_ID=CAMNT_0000787289 /DNA_START=103 /DNA_END=588 /DNA_ORIENTATION=+ /assembly_acc=CAM_ASM_000350